jgi:hypothetical protein
MNLIELLAATAYWWVNEGAMDWTAEECGFNSRKAQKTFLFSITSALVLRPTSLLPSGYQGPFPRR